MNDSNLRSQGHLRGRMRESAFCAVHKGMQDYLFEKLGSGDAQVMKTFQCWTPVRDRVHFMQLCATT